ncbi:hypothetical protein OB962_03405 [Aeromonas piscicola]|uniref:Membrane-anchored protein n=1 Tax=Aeromonas piscicola TaxID=600645 RepID=A0ABT7Q958_9GAMM|nr:hypothetical protein [Aeromonas piscicola]MDM5130051.1 hypothetical protein [Aeromonas piscicola]
MHTNTADLLNKVPEVTLVFWLIKMMSTTVGETAADFLIFNLHLGLTVTSLLMGICLIATLLIQIRSTSYVPWKYWLAVVLVSIFGTLVTDNLTDQVGVPLAMSTGVFTVMLLATFWIWYAQEKTLSIRSIDTRKRELFYWGAILVTFALGTAAGDWVSEGMDMGYMNAMLLFGALIAVTAAAHYWFRLNTVLAFWIVYVLTRPLGASIGDLLSQSEKHGGLGFGVTSTSLAFFACIIMLVGYQSLPRRFTVR